MRSRKVDTLEAAYSALTKLNLLHYSKIRYERQSRSQDGFQLLKSWVRSQKAHFLTHTEFLPVPVPAVGGESVAVATEGHRRAQRVLKIRAFKKRSDSASEGGFGRLWSDIYV